jgi:hypothetical protein
LSFNLMQNNECGIMRHNSIHVVYSFINGRRWKL